MKWLNIFIAVILVTSCGDKSVVYNEVKSISNESWLSDDPIQFEFEITDTTTAYDLFLIVRNTTAYEWSNLYLFAEIESPDKLVNVDTVEVILADPRGEWYGNVSGSMVTTEQQLINHKRFPKPGKYSLYFYQAMRENVVNGVSDLGLKIQEVIRE